MYKPNSDLSNYKLAAEVGIKIAYAHPEQLGPSMPYNKNKLHQLLGRPSDDKLSIYLRNKKDIQEFKNPSEWPSYEELAQR